VFDTRLSHSGLTINKNISIQPFIELDNVANNRYNSSVTVNANDDRYYEPAPGRHWTAGIAVEFY
jgi:iron complex outermembrane receptor protein